jgi:hypothetical protein
MASLTVDMTESERIEANGRPEFAKYASAGGDFVQREQATLLQMYSDYGEQEFAETAKDTSHTNGLIQYMDALMSIVSEITDQNVVRYLLLLLDRVTKSVQYTSAFRKPNPTVTKKLKRHLDSGDTFCIGKASMILARFTTLDIPASQVQAHLGWICDNLNGASTDFALSSLMICLSNVRNRDIYLNMNGLQLLVNVCKTCPVAQTQRVYEACFCLCCFKSDTFTRHV